MYISQNMRLKLSQKITQKIILDFCKKERSKFVLMYDTKENKFLLVDYSIMEKERRNYRKVLLLINESKTMWFDDKLKEFVKYVYKRYINLL